MQAMAVEKISIILEMRNKLMQRWKELARQHNAHSERGSTPFEIKTNILEGQPTLH